MNPLAVALFVKTRNNIVLASLSRNRIGDIYTRL